MLVQDLPSLEIQFLSLLKQFGILIYDLVQILKISFISGGLPEFDEPFLCLGVFLYDPAHHLSYGLACH